MCSKEEKKGKGKRKRVQLPLTDSVEYPQGHSGSQVVSRSVILKT